MQVIEKRPFVFIVKWKGISKELKFKSQLKKPTLHENIMKRGERHGCCVL